MTYSQLQWKICTFSYLDPNQLPSTVSCNHVKLLGVIVKRLHLANISMVLLNSEEHWATIHLLVLHSYAYEHYLGAVVPVTFRWQCCLLHHHCLQACTAHYMAHSSLATSVKELDSNTQMQGEWIVCIDARRELQPNDMTIQIHIVT